MIARDRTSRKNHLYQTVHHKNNGNRRPNCNATILDNVSGHGIRLCYVGASNERKEEDRNVRRTS